MSNFTESMQVGSRIMEEFSTSQIRLASLTLADSQLDFDLLRHQVAACLQASEGFAKLIITSALLAMRCELEARDPGFAEREKR